MTGIPGLDPVEATLDPSAGTQDVNVTKVAGTAVNAAAAAAGAVPTQELRSATSTQSNVAGAAGDTTILAANTGRRGATVFNDSTALLYLLVGAGTASSTVHTLQMVSGSYYEIPFNYTGVVKGLWTSATGAARVTEFTA